MRRSSSSEASSRPRPASRETLSFQPLDALSRDTRYAFRTMRTHKTFTALAVLVPRARHRREHDDLQLHGLDSVSRVAGREARRARHPAMDGQSADGRRAVGDAEPRRPGCRRLAPAQRQLAVSHVRALRGAARALHGSVRKPAGVAAAHRRRRRADSRRTLRHRQLLPQSRSRRSSRTVARGRRRSIRCAAGRRALVGLQHGTLRLGRGRRRAIAYASTVSRSPSSASRRRRSSGSTRSGDPASICR